LQFLFLSASLLITITLPSPSSVTTGHQLVRCSDEAVTTGFVALISVTLPSIVFVRMFARVCHIEALATFSSCTL